MRGFDEFSCMDASFWAFIRFISEMLGYTKRGEGIVKAYTSKMIHSLCKKEGVTASENVIYLASQYSLARADILNNYVEKMLMDAETAAEEYRKWERIYRDEGFLCKLPYNKQKGEMKKIAFFTAMINIIAEKKIRKLTGRDHVLGFDDDPHGLAYVWDEEGKIIGASSRRFDGAYPSIKNPKLVWEIKEHYYTTTFGSRVADGVYETQLDGFEFKELYDRAGRKVYHVLFIDAYRTWWIQGKPYLCRLIDAMNSGVVDEVIFGREVFTRWPDLLEELIL